MIGKRIRQMRLQLGLSQTQLAGKEMSRAFISQVENGKCAPSAQTLRILAERLGKPIAYFLEESPADDFGVRFLWESARQDAKRGQWDAALPKLEQVLQLLRRGDNPEQEAAVQFLYARCLARLQQTERALDQLEEVLERYRLLQKPGETREVCLEMGKCCLALEQFASARRLFERVARLTVGSKFARELHGEALGLLGMVHLRLGHGEEAVRVCQEALAALKSSPDRVLWGRTAAGLSAAYLRTGQAAAARDWSGQALRVLKAAGAPEAVGAEQNLALAEMALGRAEEGYAGLRRVLARYQETGDARGQAGVLEDLVRYWRARGEWDRAERLCWQALDLLPLYAHGWLRGVLYRHLGEITAARGKPDRALELLQISYELLGRVRATDEMAQTLAAMESVHGRGEGHHGAGGGGQQL